MMWKHENQTRVLLTRYAKYQLDASIDQRLYGYGRSRLGLLVCHIYTLGERQCYNAIVKIGIEDEH